MSMHQNNSFLYQLIRMYTDAGLPAAIVDHDFTVIWCSDAGRKFQSCLARPDGVRCLLQGHDIDKIKLEIAMHGMFTASDENHLFSEHSITLFALGSEAGEYYLVQPPFVSKLGTGMHPEGISRTLSTFTAQYRTPLTIIFSMLTLLYQNYKPDATEQDRLKSVEYLDTISQNTFKVLRSCEWISTYTRLSNGISPLRLSRLDIFQFLRELFSAAAALIEPAGIPVSYYIPPDALPMVCDTEKLSAVILNILSNSCRFTREGNSIDIKVRRHMESISISISDCGLGIPSEVLPRVFEPYYSHDHGGHPFAGNGLGLAIAKHAVKALGGTITLTSVEGEGTTVLFALPVSDDENIPPAVYCDASDYLSDRFSALHIALADSIKSPLQ